MNDSPTTPTTTTTKKLDIKNLSIFIMIQITKWNKYLIHYSIMEKKHDYNDHHRIPIDF